VSGRIYFPLADVADLAAETVAAGAWTGSWLDAEEGRETGPSLMWVKDDGTYLMSNTKRAEGEMPRVIYGSASPDGPRLDGEQWDLCREICGGDDFAEYVGLTSDDEGPGLGHALRRAARDGLRWFVLDVKGDAFEMSVR
jgi:hypothetical protein